MSRTEVENADYFTSNVERSLDSSDYARVRGVCQWKSWALRSPYSTIRIQSVLFGGTPGAWSGTGEPNYDDNGVAPAMWIKL